LNESETRNIYRSVQVGAHIELITLDLRRGMLGRYQNEWLQERLENSSSLWKIVLSGATLNLSEVDEVGSAIGELERAGETAVQNSTAVEPTEESPKNRESNNQEAVPTGLPEAPSGEQAKKTDVNAAAPVEAPQQRQRSVSISHEDPLDEFLEGGGTTGKPAEKVSYYFKSCVQSMLMSLQPDVPSINVDDAQSVKSASAASFSSSAASTTTGREKKVESIAAPEVEIPVKSWRDIVGETIVSASANEGDDLDLSIPTFNLSSGIVFVSGENYLASNNNSSSNPNFAGGFVILNNPKDIGQDAFCAEVSIGSAPPALGKQFLPEPKLGPICVYSRPRDSPEDEVVASVRTVDVPMTNSAAAAVGCALEIRFMQKSTGKPLYAARFVVLEQIEDSPAENSGGHEEDV
jgi:hypothetical protein